MTAAWDVQYSTDGSESHATYNSATDRYVRYRGTDGVLGPWQPIHTPRNTNDWIPIRTNDLVYPAGANVDFLQAAYDFGDFAELLFIVAGYRSVAGGRRHGRNGGGRG